MFKIMKSLVITIVAVAVSVSLSYAQEPSVTISEDQYISTIKTYLKKDKLHEIKHGGLIHLKVITKGMNKGYIEPKISEITDSKLYIDEFLSTVSSVTIENESINDLNNEIISRLELMSNNLNRAKEEHKSALAYDKDFLDKVGYLSFNEALSDEGSANINLTDYNEKLKEIKRVYKDIKQIAD